MPITFGSLFDAVVPQVTEWIGRRIVERFGELETEGDDDNELPRD